MASPGHNELSLNMLTCFEDTWDFITIWLNLSYWKLNTCSICNTAFMKPTSHDKPNIFTYLRKYETIFPFSIISDHWGGTGCWKPSSLKASSLLYKVPTLFPKWNSSTYQGKNYIFQALSNLYLVHCKHIFLWWNNLPYTKFQYSPLKTWITRSVVTGDLMTKSTKSS